MAKLETATAKELEAIKLEVTRTCATVGWAYIKEMGVRAVQEMIDKAISEEDELKGSHLRREAKAAKLFAEKWLGMVATVTNWNVAPDKSFNEIAMGPDVPQEEPKYKDHEEVM